MKWRRKLPALLSAVVLSGCKSGPHDGTTSVTIDLNQTTPLGYEVCADHPPQLPLQNLNLELQLPRKIELPPEAQTFGATSIEFRPGPHEVNVYRNRHSARLLWATGNLVVDGDVPKLHVKLKMAELSKGKYILGIHGDLLYAYCTVELQ